MSLLDKLMGRERLTHIELMEVNELPERKPTPDEFELHLLQNYNIELVELDD